MPAPTTGHRHFVRQKITISERANALDAMACPLGKLVPLSETIQSQSCGLSRLKIDFKIRFITEAPTTPVNSMDACRNSRL